MELLKNLNEREYNEATRRIYKEFIGKVVRIDRGDRPKNVRLANKEMVDKVLGLAFISQGGYCFFTCDTNYNVYLGKKKLDHIAVTRQGNMLKLVPKFE